MLDALRRGAKSWLAKLLILLLAVSFVFWGITLGGFGARDVARVGEVAITPEAFDRAYRAQLNFMSRQFGQPLSPAESLALGVPGQALEGLITDALLDDRAAQFGLNVSDETLAQAIRQDPQFAGLTGAFNIGLYRQRLAANRITEEEYQQNLRRQLQRRQLLSASGGAQTVPQPFVEMQYLFDNEQRAISYMRLTADELAELETPDETALKAYYDENQDRYDLPERRDVAYIALSADRLVDPDSIDADQVDAAYGNAPERFGIAETRNIHQIRFDSHAQAEAARERLDAGLDFDALVADLGLEAADVDLGFTAREEMIDPVIGDAAFSLETGAVSQPLEGRFGPVLITVNEIRPASIRPLEEVETEIRAQLATRAGESEILRLYDEIEDARAGGVTLDEIAGRFAVPLEQISGLQRDIEDAGLPDARQFMREVFDSQIGEETDPIELSQYGFLWFEVRDIVARAPQPYDSVRDLVVDDWQGEKRAGHLSKLATETVSQLDQGAQLAEIAREHDKKISQLRSLGRDNLNTADLGAGAVAAMFRAEPGKAGQILLDDGDHLIFVVDSIVQPAFFESAANVEALEQSLSAELAAGMQRRFVLALREAADIQVNEALIQTLIGLGDNPY